MKKLLAILLTLMMLLSLAACGNNKTPSGNESNNSGTSQSDNQNGTENQDNEKIDAESVAEDVLDKAEELDSFSEAAVEHYLNAYGISYESLKPEWEYTVSEKGAYADDPSLGYGHAVVVFKTPDSSELTDEQIKTYYEQIFNATAAVSDDGYNIIGHEFVGDGENAADKTTLEDALDGFIPGWCFRKDGTNMAVYISDIYDNDKDSQYDRLFYSYGVKFDIGVGLQKSFDDTLDDMENALDEYGDEIKDALNN